MGAAARGVRRGGGRIIGIIPAFFRDEAIEEIFDEYDDMIYTNTMAERITTMANISDAFITVPGGIGTFEEFFEVITLKQLGRHTKPIAIFDVNNYYNKLDEFLQMSVKEKFISENCKTLYDYSNNIDEILDYIENDDRKTNDVHDLKLG